MNGNPPHRDLDPDQVDDFLRAVARGEAPATDPLAALLGAAARTPATEGMPAGEERVIAEFRAAVRPPPTRRVPGRRVVRFAVTAGLATLCLCGIAVAVEHDAPVPDSPPHPAVSVASDTPRPNPHPALSSTVDTVAGNTVTVDTAPAGATSIHPPNPPAGGKSHPARQPHGRPDPKDAGHQKPKPGH